MRIGLSLLLAAIVVGLVGLAPSGTVKSNVGNRSGASVPSRALALDMLRTRPLGTGRAFRLPPRAGRVARGRPVAGLRCARPGGSAYRAHVELFAAEHVLPLPAEIGWAPPVILSAGHVRHGRCAYPLRTDDPAGLVTVDPARITRPTLGALFALWGQPLDAHHVAGFGSGAGVRAFLDGRPWRGDPRMIPLRHHAQVELEIGSTVAPHPGYAFPAGL